MKEDKEFSVCRIEITKVDSELRNKFKAACTLNGKNMREAIIELMNEYIAKQKPIKE